MEQQENKIKIGMNSSLGELSSAIWEARREDGKIKRCVRTTRLCGMLGWLSRYDKDFFKERQMRSYVPRKIDTVGELYSFTENEILNEFWHYKKVTWNRLNDELKREKLPPLKLPKEYRTDL